MLSLAPKQQIFQNFALLKTEKRNYESIKIPTQGQICSQRGTTLFPVWEQDSPRVGTSIDNYSHVTFILKHHRFPFLFRKFAVWK